MRTCPRPTGCRDLPARRPCGAPASRTPPGVIAATDDDAANLAILLVSRTLNPDAHVLVRQNRHPNEPAFKAARAALVMQPTLVTGRHPPRGYAMQWLARRREVRRAVPG